MIETYSGEIPWLTTEQMIEVDRAMIEDFRIDLIQMMENAGRALSKEGLRAPGVEGQVGELYLADISVPPDLYANQQLGLSVGPIVSTGDIVRLR